VTTPDLSRVGDYGTECVDAGLKDLTRVGEESEVEGDMVPGLCLTYSKQRNYTMSKVTHEALFWLLHLHAVRTR
jgi:hypothetical protein